jgi:hypothetical protein
MLNLASGVYRQALKLYPRAFRAQFADEMEAVFSEALRDAAGEGAAAILGMCLRELADLPVNLLLAHQPRKKTMKLFNYDEAQGIRVTRWIARLSSLALNIMFWVIIFTTHQQALFEATIAVMTIALLIAWRWEKTGGLITLAAALLCALIVGVNAAVTVDHISTLKAILWGVGCTVVVLAVWVPEYVLMGWLFVSLARRADLMRSATAPAH